MGQRTRPWILGLMTGLALGAVLGAATISWGIAGRSEANAVLARLAEHLVIVDGPLNGLTGPHLIFEGVNVHIRSGSGSTSDGTLDDMNEPTGLEPTGLGNLVVGYDEDSTLGPLVPGDRGGSHNLVIGPGHRFVSVGGFVAGRRNSATGPFASVSGLANTASGQAASISGGSLNTASGPVASVSGGLGNTASGDNASISGGALNTASGATASISGGGSNRANGFSASVSGGFGNTAGSSQSAVSGGANRNAPGVNDWAAGGLFQTD